MPKCSALDTSVLVYYLTEKNNNDAQECRRWDDCHEIFRSADFEFVVPSPVLAEALVKIPHEKRDQVAEHILSAFKVLVCDAESAIIAAKMTRMHVGRKRGEDTKRQCMKFDWLILGTVGRYMFVDALCSYDENQLGAAVHLPRQIDADRPEKCLARMGSNLPLPLPAKKE